MEALKGTAHQQQVHLEKLVGDYKGQSDMMVIVQMRQKSSSVPRKLTYAPSSLVCTRD